MSEILEIRDTCKTPQELIKSKTFDKYLNIYKKQFLSELKSRKNSDQRDEVTHKSDFVENVSSNIFLEILESNEFKSKSKESIYKENIRFLEGLFHHYRKKSYTRLIKLHDEILSSNGYAVCTVTETLLPSPRARSEVFESKY